MMSMFSSDDEPQLHQPAGRVVDERQQSTHRAAILEPAVFGTIDLHEFAQTFPPSSRLMRRGQLVAAIDPQPVRHHPLPQCLDADPQTVTCNQFFRRQCGSEVDVMFANQAQHRGPEGLAMLAVARPATFARRKTGRAIRRKYLTEAVNLTPTQAHQYRSGINREPIIRKINHHTQPGQFPIAHLNHPRHHTSPRTFRRQCASVTFLSGTGVTFLSGAYKARPPKSVLC
jgi:hypothetical protein